MNDQKPHTFVIYVATIVIACVILGFAGLYGYLLLNERASVPEGVTSALTAAIVGLIAVGGAFINGALTRRHVDNAAAITQAHVAHVSAELHDGLKTDIAQATADIVRKDAMDVAVPLALKVATDAASAAAGAQATTASALVENTTSVREKTAAAKENTVAMRENTAAITRQEAPAALEQNTAALEQSTDAIMQNTEVTAQLAAAASPDPTNAGGG